MSKVIMRPWTPDNCPVQAGMCIHDVSVNVDILVAKRYLNYDGNNTDEDKLLLELANGDRFTGRDLFEQPFTYYPKWPCTLEEKSCYNEVEVEEEEPVLISNLVMSIFDGLRSANIAKEDVHYSKEDGIYVWEDDLATAVNNAANDLATLFKEYKHDEQ